MKTPLQILGICILRLCAYFEFMGYFQMEGIELTVQGYHGEFHLVFFLIISNMFVV